MFQRLYKALIALVVVTATLTGLPALAASTPFLALDTDKARYQPGDTVTFTATTNDAVNMTLAVKYFQLETQIATQSVMIDVDGSTTWTWRAPAADYTGYLAQVSLLANNKAVSTQTIGIDVSSDWSKFPRYGFLSDFSQQSIDPQNAVIASLNRFHINGLQFYDWQDKHDQPLTLIDGQPISQWQDIAGRTTYLSNISNYIDLAHAHGMKAMNYNLINGAYVDYAARGISPQWGLYQDDSHQTQAGWPLPGSWESDLRLFDPSNVDWQNYLIAQEQGVASKLAFDGWHVDQLGNSDVYNYSGQPVNLAAGYSSFLKKAKSVMAGDLVMNAVDDYAETEIMKSGATQFAYEELWGGNSYYSDILRLVETNWKSKSTKPSTVFAAYMNKPLGQLGGQFNTPGVLLTEASILAAGGAHIELGEHMLSNEYFPNDNLQATTQLLGLITPYYDFSVAYENLLRGGVKPLTLPVSIKYQKISNGLAMIPGTIWTFARATSNGSTKIIHLINMKTAQDDAWRDDFGKRHAVKKLSNFTVTFKQSTKVHKIWTANPDGSNIAPVALKFTQSKGVVTVKVPSLTYWTMLVVK